MKINLNEFEDKLHAKIDSGIEQLKTAKSYLKEHFQRTVDLLKFAKPDKISALMHISGNKLPSNTSKSI